MEKKKKETVCHYCGKEGHFRRKCRKLEYDRKNIEKDSERSQKANVVIEDEAEEVCLATGQLGGESGEVVWCLDSGATSHMTCDASLLENVINVNTTIGLADGNKIAAVGAGSMRFRKLGGNGKDVPVTIKQVYHVPALAGNLLSVSRMTDEGCSLIFTKTDCEIQKNGKVLLRAERCGNLYRLKSSVQKVFATVVGYNEDCIHVWHRRLGHRDTRAIERIVRDGLGTGLKMEKCAVNSECGVCCESKMARAPFPKKSSSTSSAVGDLVHTDLCGPLEVSTPHGNRYLMTMVDDYSRYCVLYLLANKSEAAGKTVEYSRMLQNQFGRLPKVIRFDGGGEYSGAALRKFLDENGILLEQTAPYSPQQNGTAERKNRTLQEMMRCLLSEAGLTKQYWGEAVTTANLLLNMLPTAAIDVTPYERWWGKNPDYSFLRVFGAEAYVHVPDVKRRKLDPNAKKMVFVGYAEGRKAYRFLDLSTNRVTVG
ncbi:hypothetical protein RP20_CCG014874 [Aedes albopictus]|nr:hypothetical protein RP20_CCG014874 [Aedes albopictus]